MNGWGGDDFDEKCLVKALGRLMARKNPTVEHAVKFSKPDGFECEVNEDEAMDWLKVNRPVLFDRLSDASWMWK